VNEAKLAQLNPSQSVIKMYRVADPEAELSGDVEFRAIETTTTVALARS
jgi:hypothetical protein